LPPLAGDFNPLAQPTMKSPAEPITTADITIVVSSRMQSITIDSVGDFMNAKQEENSRGAFALPYLPLEILI